MNMQIRKNILSLEEKNIAHSAIAKGEYIDLEGIIENFVNKEEYKGKTILQRSNVIIDKKGNILCFQRSKKDHNNENRITKGYSILSSGIDRIAAKSKISGLIFPKNPIQKILLKNNNYIFDIFIYQKQTLPLQSISFKGNDQIIIKKLREISNLIKDKPMELAILNETKYLLPK